MTLNSLVENVRLVFECKMYFMSYVLPTTSKIDHESAWAVNWTSSKNCSLLWTWRLILVICNLNGTIDVYSNIHRSGFCSEC